MLSYVFFLSLYYVNILYIYITDMLHMSVKYFLKKILLLVNLSFSVILLKTQ